MVNVAGSVGKVASAGGGKAVGVVSWIFRYKFIFFTLFAVFFLLWDNLKASIKCVCVKPLLEGIGSKVAMADLNLYNFLVGLNASNITLWSSVKSLITVFSYLWIIFMFVYIFAKLISYSPWSNTSNTFINYTLAIVLVILVATPLYCLGNNELLGVEENKCFAVLPGVRKLFGMDVLFNPIKNLTSKWFDKQTMSDNISITDTSINDTLINNTYNLTNSTYI